MGGELILRGRGGEEVIIGCIFFPGRWVYNCGAYKWEGGAYIGGGGVLSDEFFFQAGGPITAGLISGRGALLEGGGGRLIIGCTFFQVGGPITLGLISVVNLFISIEQIKQKVFKCSLQSILKKVYKWIQVDKKQQHCNQ